MNQSVFDRIHALNLDPFTETVICEIVQDAINAERKTSLAVVLQIPGDWPADYFDIFWQRYPNKTAKPRASKALENVAKNGKTHWSDLINGLDRYISSRKVQRGFIKNPATWINDQGWKDQESEFIQEEKPKSFFEIAAGR